MEKRWVLVGLSMEEGCFVEKREIAGRAGNDGIHTSCPILSRHARLDRASRLFVHQKGYFDGETVGFGGFVHGRGLFRGEAGDCRSSRQ